MKNKNKVGERLTVGVSAAMIATQTRNPPTHIAGRQTQV